MTAPDVTEIAWPCSEYALAGLAVSHLAGLLEQTRAGAAAITLVHYGTRTPAYAELGGAGGCSLAWSRIDRIEQIEDEAGVDCGTEHWVYIELGVYRCIRIPAQGQKLPDAEIDSAARDTMDDGRAMRAAVVAVTDTTECQTGSQKWNPIAASGGIIGGRLLFRIRAELGMSPDVIPPFEGDPRATA